MNIDTINFLSQAKKAFIQFNDSGLAFGIKIFLAIYVAVLVVDIILIIIVHTPGMYFRVLKGGANVPIPKKVKMQKRWEKVKARLQKGDAKQLKAAVLEADEIVNEILLKVGYAGENMGERLDGISADQLETIEELKEAHKVRNEIVRRADFELNQEQAEETVETYQKTLEILEFL
jgi:hypothetical protein